MTGVVEKVSTAFDQKIKQQIAEIDQKLIESFNQREVMQTNLDTLDNNISSFRHTKSTLMKLLPDNEQEPG